MAYLIIASRDENKLSCLFDENENKQAFSFYNRLIDNGFQVAWKHFPKLSKQEWIDKQYNCLKDSSDGYKK